MRNSKAVVPSRNAVLMKALGAAQIRHHLNTAKISGTAGLFSVTGTPDILLYAQAPVLASNNGDPRSNGYTLNLSWWPEQNIDLAVQYTGYLRFNGAQINYDGVGRAASGNNAVFLHARFVF